MAIAHSTVEARAPVHVRSVFVWVCQVSLFFCCCCGSLRENKLTKKLCDDIEKKKYIKHLKMPALQHTNKKKCCV